MADGIYAGGIPGQGGKVLHPAEKSEGNEFAQPNAGPSEETAKKGSPAEPHGSSNEGFLDQGTYKVAGDLREGGMKVVDLNDISHEA